MVQDSVIAAEQRRLQVQPRWMVAASRYAPTDKEYAEAKQEFDKAIAELGRLIPADIRDGLPLIPDAVQKFRTCNRADFAQ